MNYTNIQIGVHEQNMHMTLEQFGGVQIDEIARPERIIAEDGTGDMYYNENDRDYFISEDNSYTVIESLDGFSITGDSQTIPSESGKVVERATPFHTLEESILALVSMSVLMIIQFHQTFLTI